MASERILVVDDERGVVRSCIRILQRYDFNVTGTTDGQSVPELLRQETFDLLLTDIRMPKLDGLDLLKIAKEIDPHLTVILITGYGTMEDAIKAIHLGAQGFIMKPFEPDDLVATIRDSLARRALIRDSLRLQTLLPLLEINQILQVSGGEISLARRILEIAHRETGATRLAWLRCEETGPLAHLNPKGWSNRPVFPLAEMLVVPDEATVSCLPASALAKVVIQARPLWLLKDGNLVDEINSQPNVVGVLLPVIIKGQVIGILTAETDRHERTGPFNRISLDLLSVLAGQLAMIVENVQLFQQTETLHAFNKDIIQTMTNGLIAVDKLGRITAFNPAAAMMLGQESEAVLYQPMEEALVGGETLTALLSQTLATGQAKTHCEITVQHWDGTHLPVAASVAPLFTRDELAELMGVVGVLEDLSEVKALEAERRRLDRLAALGEMSAVVAHEIRNPMAGIAAGVEYLTRKISPNSPDFEGVGMIQAEIRRVNRILEDILFVARPLQLNLSQENVVEVIENVLQRCQPQIQASKLQVVSTHTANLPLLCVDRQRLEQVFSNLIINATQAMQNGGQLSLQTELVTTRNGQQAEIVVITVADTGPGISADLRRRVFEPFFTTKTRGTGLGLAVARRIVEEHQGTINIESEPEQGTRFIIKLPVKSEAAG